MNINQLGQDFYFRRDSQSFTNLYLELRPLLINWVKQKFPVNYDKAVELADTALEKIYTRIHQFKPQYNFLNWALQITKNEFKMDYNKTKPLVYMPEMIPVAEKYYEKSQYITEEEIDEEESKRVARAARQLIDPSLGGLFGGEFKFRIKLFTEYVDVSTATCESLAKEHNIKTHNVIKYLYQVRRELFSQLKDNQLHRQLNYKTTPYDTKNSQQNL
jgi:RNA polymerase sigma factor (sigma-70 family)